jgi:hypothetical protein
LDRSAVLILSVKRKLKIKNKEVMMRKRIMILVKEKIWILSNFFLHAAYGAHIK